MDLHHELYEGFNNLIYSDQKKKKKNTNEISDFSCILECEFTIIVYIVPNLG